MSLQVISGVTDIGNETAWQGQIMAGNTYTYIGHVKYFKNVTDNNISSDFGLTLP